MQTPMEYRVRSRVSETEMSAKIGKILTDDDYNLVLTGATKIALPSGEPLCVYLPKCIPLSLRDQAYPILHTIQGMSDARGYASGSEATKRVRQNMYRPVKSSIIGSIDPISGGRYPYCRQTAWTGRNTEQFQELFPLFEFIGQAFKTHVPNRYAKQAKQIQATHPDWKIGATPFTTITVNNTYPTGVHKDKGDLEKGFSCLMALRRGEYTGGYLTFPEYRIAVNMQDGDLLLMDAHQWHGNTAINRISEDAERISLVLYFRTKMINCGSLEDELEKEARTKARSLKNTIRA